MFKKLNYIRRISAKFSKPPFILFIGIIAIIFFHALTKPMVKINKKTRQILENTIYMNLETGKVIIELYPDVAPKHTERFKSLIRSGYYDGGPWHRVVGELFAQCCDRSGKSLQTEGYPIDAEISDLPHIRGAISMARKEDINSATSQFFIVLSDARFFDGKYTVFGYIKEGIELIDSLKRGDRSNYDLVTKPDIIVSMEVAIDTEKERIGNNKKSIYKLFRKILPNKN